MLFISIVLEDYSLYALHLAIPPPWGFHLSNPPNISSHPRKRNQNRNSKWYATKDKEREGGHQASINHYHLSTSSSHLAFSFYGSKAPKSGSGESESEAPSPSEGVGYLS
jgi:hypothetical protein